MENRQPARGRPRTPATDDRIVSAVLALIREQGPEAVNVASVSARSGVARTTIYRRYRDRTEMLHASLRPATDPGEPPARASVREKLAWVLARTQEVLAGSIGLGGVAAVVADRDPEFSAALRASLRSALHPIQEQISLDVSAGRIASHVDPDLVLNLILGAYLAEVVRYGGPRAEWLEETADLLALSLGVDG